MPVSFDIAPQDWLTLRRLLDEALERPPSERAVWIEQLDSSFEAFRPRLRALLAHAGDSSALAALDTLPKIETAQFLAERQSRDAEALRPGASVGPYRLIRPLGEGGMGAVWLAERTDMLHRRQVALKLPRILTGRAALAERLAREREILAALNHPNIARLYDAGLGADGQPYLALEYVDGERIDAYCRREQLDVPERLRLFLQVARAVAHAHANLVVHRDLKPSNVLVTQAGEVRLLDFGIAKLLDDGHAQESELTQLAGRALTPDYAAPEQILGQPISTATDIYSLGVVLFELLAGKRPYHMKRHSRAALEEAILAAEPPRPSAVAADAQARKALRGDLDIIVLKALKKQAEQRYATVNALIEDIERYRAGRPVAAQPDSRIYRARKFAARNKIPVGAAASVLIAIIVGAAASAWQARVARTEQQRASQISEFIASVFRDADPYTHSAGRPVTALELLARAEKRIDAELGGQREVRIELLKTLGRSYAGLFDHSAAERVLGRVLSELGSGSGAAPPEVAELQILLGETKKLLGKYQEAKGLLARALETMKLTGMTQSRVFIDAKLLESGIALYEGDYPRVKLAAAEAIQLSEALNGTAHAQTASGYGMMARASGLLREGESQRDFAEKSYRALLALHGNDHAHPSVIEAQETLGVALIGLGDLKQAGLHIEQAFDNARRVFGVRNTMTGHIAARVGQIQILRGELREGIRTTREAIAALADIDTARGPATAGRNRSLALGLLWSHRPADAIAPLGEAIAILRDKADRRSLLIVQADYAAALVELGRLDEADALLHEIEAEGSRLQPPELPLRQRARWHLARGNPSRAVPLLETALMRARADPRKLFLPELLADLGRAHLRMGDSVNAGRLLGEALAAFEEAKVRVTPDHARTMILMAAVLQGSGARRDALTLLERADAFWRDFDPQARGAGESALALARCYDVLGRSGDAKQAYARASKIISVSRVDPDTQLVQRERRASPPARRQADAVATP